MSRQERNPGHSSCTWGVRQCKFRKPKKEDAQVTHSRELLGTGGIENLEHVLVIVNLNKLTVGVLDGGVVLLYENTLDKLDLKYQGEGSRNVVGTAKVGNLVARPENSEERDQKKEKNNKQKNKLGWEGESTVMADLPTPPDPRTTSLSVCEERRRSAKPTIGKMLGRKMESGRQGEGRSERRRGGVEQSRGI